jgi:HAD superfamily hydrolase (TIGR01509 family)
MKVCAVIFDMDGVIFDTEKLSNLSWKIAGKHFGVEFSDEFLEKLLGINHKDALPIYFDYLGDTDLGERIFEWRHQWIENEFRRKGVPIKAGIREIFQYLHDHKIPTALATSSPRKYVDRNFSLSEIQPSFDAIITGDMLTNGKPHPEIYLKAAEALHVDIHQCMVIEDSTAGVMGGVASGAMTVMVPDMVQPTPEIMEKVFSVQKSLLNVIDLIERLNRD